MIACIHCDEVTINAFFDEDDTKHLNPFCCFGCLTVYQIIHQKGLESYYEIKKQSSLLKRRSPVDIKSVQFKFLDDPQFLEEYTYLSSSHEKTMEFYLEGIHCLACLWLIEKLPEFMDAVVSSKLDLERSVVTVVLKENGKFENVGKEFNFLGYRPHPLKKNQATANLKLKEERSALIRIGVAGAAAGNIMIYAVSLYGGASDGYGKLFNLLTVIFAIPVLTYCAYPFYKNAWHAIKNKTVSIDIPISIALIIGGLMGIYNLFMAVSENYFDSLTTLVFLLLLSRYFQQKIQTKGLSAQDLHSFYQCDSVLRAETEDHTIFHEIHPRFIKVNDVLKIPAGDFIPVDGVVLIGTSNVNNSLLTGESLPVKVYTGEKVFSGTQNIDHELIIRSDKIQDETRLGRILKNVENGWAHKSKMVDLTSKVSKFFTIMVFFLAVFLFVHLYLKGNTSYALEQAITLLIVTCPCALALATPLTFTRALTKASQQGIIIKNDEVIEKLSNVKNIFIDKTGTITHGHLKILNFYIWRKPVITIEEIIFHLERKSRHPVALALLDFSKNHSCRSYIVTNHIEQLGVGVSGMINQNFYEINKGCIYENNFKVATFEVGDSIRADSPKALRDIQSYGLVVSILSGDNPEIVQSIASVLNLPAQNALGGLSPEEKNLLIKKSSHSMMIGDGANDAIALSHADVGVAVMGAMDISLRAADVYLTTPGLVPVEKLLVLSKETMKVIRRNLVLSLAYNSVSVTAVFMGLINPLVAAVIMPLSSLTVLASTIVGTRKLRLLWK